MSSRKLTKEQLQKLIKECGLNTSRLASDYLEFVEAEFKNPPKSSNKDGFI